MMFQSLVFFVSVVVLTGFYSVCAQNNQVLDLMPMPASITVSGEKFRLDDSFRVAISGRADKKLYRYATGVLRRLSGRTGLFFTQDYLTPEAAADSANCFIQTKDAGNVEFGVDESYSLAISTDRVALISETDIGAMRGLETLLQLLSVDDKGYYFPTLEIQDAPRFPWRGLMIDACRHFMPFEVIKRNLDAMAAVKLNVLHWHLSDDQGFRVESKVYPKLQELGSDGYYYTQEQIKEVIAYAAERGIRVVPEFDVPGHATSWLAAYPELGSAPGPYKIERKWGIFFPVLNPVNEFTYQFLEKFFSEMAALFPDKYFHIGGDEIEHAEGHEAEHWNENAEIQAFMKKNNIPDNSALQAHFNNRILEILGKNDKIMVGWDEILHESMPKNIVIQSWRGHDSMVKAAQLGYRSILSNGYYIDLIQPTDYHYLNDPLPEDVALSEAEQAQILGGEATMWSEYVSPETIDSRIWPRTAAIAERFWSPRDVNDVDDMYRRLQTISFQLEEHGLTHEKNYPMLLRRLTRNQDIQPLKNLVDVVEPVKIYNRGKQRPYTSFSPLTRVVDAARPDAQIAREFREMVDEYLADIQGKQDLSDEIRKWLTLWRGNHAKLVKVIEKSPILVEIESLSEDLAILAQMGLESLAMIEKNERVNEKWFTEKMALVEKAKTPRGQVELMIIPGIERMVNASMPAEVLQSEHN